jgi:hypothetical protein
VIVNIAGWLYIVQAALGLTSLVLSPFGFSASRENLVTLAFCALIGAMGVGLLKRHPTARWFALGSSFLGWTLGSLGLIGIIGALVVAGGASQYFGGSLFSALAALAFVVLLICVVGVIISFKLFWYLCSREGCEEFGVHYGSASTVVKSLGAWIGIFVVNFFMASGGGMSLLPAFSSKPSYEEASREARQFERDQEMRRRNERAAARAREIEEAEARARSAAASAAAMAQNAPDAGSETPMVEEAPAPTIGAAPPVRQTAEEEKPSANRILKCRDGSGAVSYTQGYCPPGTQEVATPKSE